MHSAPLSLTKLGSVLLYGTPSVPTIEFIPHRTTFSHLLLRMTTTATKFLLYSGHWVSISCNRSRKSSVVRAPFGREDGSQGSKSGFKLSL